uniref:Uncharacterized protein n=1 Tax=Onchocerca volvulus TaxID=6282 RepID=A0A8R1XWP0_ONCVO
MKSYLLTTKLSMLLKDTRDFTITIINMTQNRYHKDLFFY